MAILRKTVENSKTSGGSMQRFGDGRDILVREYEIEVDDVLKFKPMYESAYHFFKEEGLRHPKDGSDTIEDLYWERWTPTGAKEQHVWWRLAKEINPYLRWFITVNYQTLNVTKKETQWKGKKVDAEKIDVVIRVRCILQFDYKDKFKNSIGWSLRKVFFNKIYLNEIEQAKIDLKKFSVKIERFYKNYLEVTMDEDAPVDFWAPRGYKE